MAYKTADLEKKALEAIEKYKLFFIEDVVSYLPCSKQTFYDHELDKLDSIKDALEKNKVEVKVGLRSKWYKSDNPTCQIALYKLIGTKEEAERINSQYTTVKVDTDHLGAIEKAFDQIDEEIQPEPKISK